ncbi:MAG: ABC transporter ATP-binding protein [Candidatus Natronoplasma sp.]
MKSAVLHADGLSKWYGDVIGLNSLNIEISGGITGIVGPNGAGKSTLFKLALGMIKPSNGNIYVMGERPWLNDDMMKNIGFCPDYDNLSNYSTGRKYLEYLGKLHGMNGNPLNNRINRVSSSVGAEDFLERKIRGYSKGMRQRLKIAGALLHDPKLLLLDEPLSGADPKTRKDIIEMIKELHNEKGHHILVSSHVLSEIERMTNQIALIYKGRKIASGDISEIRNLIDEKPHNIVIEGGNKIGLAKRLVEENYVVSVGFEDNRRKLVVEVSNPEIFFNKIALLVNETETEIFEMYSRDDNLQAVFDYLVGGER